MIIFQPKKIGMKSRTSLIAMFTAFVFASPHIWAQSELTIEEIMQGPAYVGYLPSSPYWSDQGDKLYFRWNPEGKPSDELYVWSPGDAQPRPLSYEEQRLLEPRSALYDQQRTRKVFARQGDLFIKDLTSGEVVQITNTVESERPLRWSGDEGSIIYVRGNNLFAWNILAGGTRQITDFRKGSASDDKPKSEQKQWLEADQLAYFEILSKRKQEREYRQSRTDSLHVWRPRKIYLGKSRLSQLNLDPTGRFVTYRLATVPKSRRTKVPDYVTQEGYLGDVGGRPKVGDDQPLYSTWIYQVAADTHFQVDMSQLPGIYHKPAYLRDYHQGEEAYVDTFATARAVMASGAIHDRDGKYTVLVIRSADNKDRWIASLDLQSRQLSVLDWQHDDAWIGGPGIAGWNQSVGNIGWLPDGETLWFQSESTGYSHLYTYHLPTAKKTALTAGTYEVLDASLSHDGERFFLHASKENAFERHFYHLPVKGGDLTKITASVGGHTVVLSPDESKLAILYSYSNQPTELYWQENTTGAAWQQITHSTTEPFEAYDWRDPEIVHFTARDGVEVPARIYRPSPEKKNGAGVVFVHGAGYLHNVHRWWSSYYREYMFHNFLADQGYTVLDIDYRGSAGYGRDWRTAIYRHMGGQDLDDQVDGAKYLVASEGIAADRLGIYGGSYGGFITLMALCTAPGTFQCGAALRSVTDWAHYNHGYTSNILNTPATDSLAFYRSSPIYHAEGLEGDLVMLHGIVDSNVQFQDVVRMSQRFIELGKDNWELAVFPMEGHGFQEPSSWVDEYKRIYRLFENNLRPD